MRKETKYTLFSLPLTYLLLVVISLILSATLDGGKCGTFAAFSISKVCGIGEFIKTAFINGFALSVYFFPVYIVISLITFFITRHFRKNYEAKLVTQLDTVPQKSKKVIAWIVVTIILFVLLYMWVTVGGLSIVTQFLPESSREKQLRTVTLKCYDKYPEIGNLAVEEILKLQALRAQCIKNGGY